MCYAYKVLVIEYLLYTFQTLSYVAFISFFPQLVAGPIERTSNLQISVVRGDEAVDTVKFVYTVDPETMIVNTSAKNRW